MIATQISDDQLWQLVESIWSTMLDLGVSHGCDRAIPAACELVASVDIDGAYQGSVMFLSTEHFARRATASLLAVPENSVAPADIDDAIGELCNILAGGVKNLVPAPSCLSLPSVIRGGQPDSKDMRDQLTAGLCFTCEAQPLEIRIMERVDARRVSGP